MKTYFRLLSFAKPIEKFAIPYILFTLLYVVFSSMVFVLLTPLLYTIFGTNSASVTLGIIQKPNCVWDVSAWFKYYESYFIHTHGPWGALQFVCAVIIVTILIGDFFR